MVLNYLDFDASDDDTGTASWDAMVSTLPLRLPQALREVEAVLHWAHSAFGPPDADAAELAHWDFDLQLLQEAGRQSTCDLEAKFDAAARIIKTRAAQQGGGYCVLTLTLSGSPAFGRAFTERFGLP